ncbi:MAG: hypothetical protein ABJR46_17605 [Tateyamaria sp.]|uniref:hypothetical protein n=1 Tax=Tateyamaria sp. TaxID=1929288 RepID=UPI00329CAFE9
MDIKETSAPSGSLIAAYAARDGYYTDCFETPCEQGVTLPDFMNAFYTQFLFRAERVVLRFAARAPSTDSEVAALAAGTSTRLAIWQVEERRADQVLLREKSGRTASWLQVDDGLLRFGSVVVPVAGRGGKPTLGPVFDSLMGVHKVYSRALLSGAARRLARS